MTAQFSGRGITAMQLTAFQTHGTRIVREARSRGRYRDPATGAWGEIR